MAASHEIVMSEKRKLCYWIYLNRPEKLNALDTKTWNKLIEELNKGCKSDSVAIVLTGKGRAFSTGDDINEMLKLNTKEEAIKFFNGIKQTLNIMISCEKPIISLVNGLAVGGGAEILLASDIVIASDNSWFSFPEISLGLIPPILISVGGGALGFRRSKYLALTGTRFSAQEAKNMGLVDEIVPQVDLEKEAFAIADTLSNYSQEAINSIKRITYEIYWKDLEKSIDALTDLVITKDAKYKMESFESHKLKPVKNHNLVVNKNNP
ncbi:enoyl-CoA hydratase/isomerase family protein [Caldisphaera lagunensis]|uniref:enoyl-CoA hydratase/isomerase family protein n=1 Tax=Caldisphaera lagunensis TaxID=200415 RepID=UPI00066216F8|nr:enoyl-CoA hydratase/isomerase family protein [Caldisphaera lagunensis]